MKDDSGLCSILGLQKSSTNRTEACSDFMRLTARYIHRYAALMNPISYTNSILSVTIFIQMFLSNKFVNTSMRISWDTCATEKVTYNNRSSPLNDILSYNNSC